MEGMRREETENMAGLKAMAAVICLITACKVHSKEGLSGWREWGEKKLRTWPDWRPWPLSSAYCLQDTQQGGAQWMEGIRREETENMARLKAMTAVICLLPARYTARRGSVDGGNEERRNWEHGQAEGHGRCHLLTVCEVHSKEGLSGWREWGENKLRTWPGWRPWQLSSAYCLRGTQQGGAQWMEGMRWEETENRARLKAMATVICLLPARYTARRGSVDGGNDRINWEQGWPTAVVCMETENRAIAYVLSHIKLVETLRKHI